MNPETLKLFKETPKALSVHEFLAIRWLVQQAPLGDLCSIGSHAGGDSIAAASVESRKGILFMIDPLYDLENKAAWKETAQGDAGKIPWGYAKDPFFSAHVVSRVWNASLGRMAPIPIGLSFSQFAANTRLKNIAYAFSDADAHEFAQIMAEVELLEGMMVPGGILALHDYGNYAGPVQAHAALIRSGKWTDVPIPWDEIKAEADALGGEAGNKSWHEPENPRPCRIAALRRNQP